MAELVTVQVIRKPKKDAFGNRPAGPAPEWDVPGWQFAPGPSQEMSLGGGQVETGGTLYGPPKSAVDAIVPDGVQPTDHIRVRSDVYQVVGRVQDWGEAGTVIVLKRVTG